MSEWDDIPQDLPPPSRAKPAQVKLRLGAYGRGGPRSCVTVTIPAAVHQALGWEPGNRLGLAIGHGRTEGWLRLSRDATGRTLRRLSSRDVLLAHFIPPEAWWRLQSPSTPCKHRIQGDALLVRIPWDMDDIAAAAPAEEEA